MFTSTAFILEINNNTSAIRQNAHLKMGFTRKLSTLNFPRSEHFLPRDTHTYVCVSGGKKCSIFRKFGVLYFLVTSILRFHFCLITDEYRMVNCINPFLANVPILYSLKTGMVGFLVFSGV